MNVFEKLEYMDYVRYFNDPLLVAGMSDDDLKEMSKLLTQFWKEDLYKEGRGKVQNWYNLHKIVNIELSERGYEETEMPEGVETSIEDIKSIGDDPVPCVIIKNDDHIQILPSGNVKIDNRDEMISELHKISEDDFIIYGEIDNGGSETTISIKDRIDYKPENTVYLGSDFNTHNIVSYVKKHDGESHLCIPVDDYEKKILYCDKFIENEYYSLAELENSSFSDGDKVKVRIFDVSCQQSEKVSYNIDDFKVIGLCDDNVSKLSDIDIAVRDIGSVVKLSQSNIIDKDFYDMNWHEMYPSEGKGRWIYHDHWTNLDKESSTNTNEELFELGSGDVHGDMRFELEEGKSAWGVRISLEDIDQNRESDYTNLFVQISSEREGKLEMDWKSVMPYEWVEYALEEPRIHNTDDGSFSKFFALDHGLYEIGVAHKHFREIFLESEEGLIEGRLIFRRVTWNDEKVWLVMFPEDQTPLVTRRDREQYINELLLDDVQHDFLIWNEPNTDRKPLKIDLSNNYSKEHWMSDQIAEKKISENLWKQNTEPRTNRSDVPDIKDSGHFVIQKHESIKFDHYDIRLDNGENLVSFYYKDGNAYPKLDLPKSMMAISGLPPLKPKYKEQKQFFGEYEIVSSGVYKKEDNTIVLKDKDKEIGFIELISNKAEVDLDG